MDRSLIPVEVFLSVKSNSHYTRRVRHEQARAQSSLTVSGGDLLPAHLPGPNGVSARPAPLAIPPPVGYSGGLYVPHPADRGDPS